MTPIDLPPTTHSDLSLLAQAWGVDVGIAVQRLIDRFREGSLAPVPKGNGEAASGSPPDGWLEVYADYAGVRVTGQYDPKTRSVRVTSGVSAQRTFKSPSGAAVAVVSELNPTVDPNRNGWSFWNLSESGETLQQVRRRAHP